MQVVWWESEGGRDKDLGGKNAQEGNNLAWGETIGGSSGELTENHRALQRQVQLWHMIILLLLWQLIIR